MAAHPTKCDGLDAAVARWFQHATDRGVFITDERFVVCKWNRWLATQTGRSEADVVGHQLFDLFPTLAERQLDQHYRNALAGEVQILSERLHKYLLPITRNFHGVGLTEMAQTARIEPLTDGATIVGTITVIEDVTERVVTERELRNQIAASDQARRLAEDASRLKDDFLATLSHEIRTPLNAVIGWAQMLRTERSPRAREHALDVIDRNARSQLRLVEDLLDMARILSGKLQLKTEVISLADVVRAALEVVAPAASVKRITVETAFDDEVPEISGDADRLQQVAWNLLSNAVKFTEAGGNISVQVASNGDQVKLTIRDDGQGIQRDFLPYVFDRFRQADPTPSRRHGGLGLGLALVKQIIELHGGTVGADSAGPKTGATFWVMLPAATAGAKDRLSELAAQPVVTLQGVSVLVVDDDGDARDLMVALLEPYGAVVRAVPTAVEALELLRDRSLKPDVLVSDVGMPGTDGYALIREVRSWPSDGPQLPAIAVTAYANPDDRVRALVAGYQRHIGKPVDGAVLASAIASLVGRAPRG